jgi:O-antigen biosynthesis protein
MTISRLFAIAKGLYRIKQRLGYGYVVQRGLHVLRACWREGDSYRLFNAISHAAAPHWQAATYKEWIVVNEARPEGWLELQGSESSKLAFRPVFSIVVPTYNTQNTILKAFLDSVLAQSYPYWELCIADDASTLPSVRETLEVYAKRDNRVRVVYRGTNGHIAGATNTAMEIAIGDFICLMDHDDVIAPNALYEFACLLNANPDLDMVYSDEDKLSVDGKQRFDPFFKPDWSPETLLSCMYTAHFACYRRTIVQQIGGFRAEFNGAQDYDFVLRFTTLTQRVAHVPKILYHWRAIPGSTAASMDNKHYVVAAGERALTEHLQRAGVPAFARSSSFKGCFEARLSIEGRPLVSIIIPSAGRDATVRGRSIDLLAHCIESIETHTTYKNRELVVVDNQDLRPSTLSALERWPVRYVHYGESVFNIATKMNMGAREATGEYLLFLNDDVEIITPDWIEAMLSLAQNPGVGAVGAKLFFEDGTLQHVGVTFCKGLPDHIHRGQPGDIPGYFFSAAGIRNYLAVTGACLLIRRDVFFAVGGFDEVFAINYNDIDLCLRVHELGYRNVYAGQAQLFHFESRTRERTVAQQEIDLFLQRWADKVRIDPFYSSYFDAAPPDYVLARPEVAT